MGAMCAWRKLRLFAPNTGSMAAGYGEEGRVWGPMDGMDGMASMAAWQEGRVWGPMDGMASIAALV
jgi:hypothetical protein